MTYFLTGNPQYHRRDVVSRSCSGWEGVGPTRYGRQEFWNPLISSSFSGVRALLRCGRNQRQDRRVSVKDVKTGKVSQYKAEPVGIKALKVGDKVDLVGAQLRPAAGAAIPVRLQP